MDSCSPPGGEHATWRLFVNIPRAGVTCATRVDQATTAERILRHFGAVFAGPPMMCMFQGRRIRGPLRGAGPAPDDAVTLMDDDGRP